MPTYQYACRSCGHRFDIVQGFHDDALATCPNCEVDGLRKLFGNVGVVFKGSGFYRNDSRSGAKSTSAANSNSKSDGESKATPAAAASKDAAPSSSSGTGGSSAGSGSAGSAGGSRSSGGKDSSTSKAPASA